MAIKKINYHGNSKILLRLCEVVNSIIDAGTGGTTVSYQQTLQSGTETGEITIDGVATKMYAPTPPTKVSDLQNDTGFITSTVSNLINYYTKTETYTKAEVDAAVAAVSTLNLLVVQTLPTQDISTTTIYLVPKQTAGTQNVYDEYIYIVTGGSGSWELIGDTTVDLSNYYTKTEIDSKLTANNISFDDSDCQSIQNVSNVQDALEAVDIGLSTHTDAISSLVSTISGKADDNQTFTEAQTRANIESGESFATILGKIKKWFTDIPSMFVSKSGDTMSGNLIVDKQDGTASAIGNSHIRLGNATAEGTAKNSRGVLRLYGRTNKYAEIFDDKGLTDNRALKIPNKNGEITVNIFAITKYSYNNQSVTLYISGGWDRYGILMFGNANGASIVGTILIEPSDYGYVKSPVTVLRNGSPLSLTVTKNNDDSITISGLSEWGNYTFISQWDIS